MSSLFSNNNANDKLNNNNNNSLNDNTNKENNCNESKNQVAEVDLLEMLKSMGINKESNISNKQKKEMDINNEKLNDIIDKLPNLNYLTSKYVEIPDSIFNI